MKINRSCNAALLALLGLSACAGSSDEAQDVGQRISERGGEIAQYGASWSAGQKDVDRGQRLAKASDDDLGKAQKKLIDARAAVSSAEAKVRAAKAARANAEQLINAGQTRMQKAEDDYGAAKAGPAANQTQFPD